MIPKCYPSATLLKYHFKLSDVARKNNCFSPTNCPRAKEIVKRRSALANYCKNPIFNYPMSRCIKIVLHLRIVLGRCLWVFVSNFDSKNLFQSKLSLVSWTSLRVAHNVCVSAVAGIGGLNNGAQRNVKADQLRPVPLAKCK